MKKTRILNYNGFSVYPGVRLIGKEKYQKLYHYTSFDTFIRIWLSKQLKFGEIDNVNDIIEVNHGWSTNNFDSIQIATRYHELRSAYKQISFTMDYDSFYKGCMSPMMWGIYGNKGRGVCIEFDFNKMNFSESSFRNTITYKENINTLINLPDGLKINGIEKFIKKNNKKIFFIKDKSWSKENEFKIIDNKNDYLDISESISAIYLSSSKSNEYLMVKKIVHDEVPVRYLSYSKSNDHEFPYINE